MSLKHCQGWKEEKYFEISFLSHTCTLNVNQVLIIELVEIILEPAKSLATNDLYASAPGPSGGWPALLVQLVK